MAKPRLDLRSRKDVDLQQFAQSVIQAMREGGPFAPYQAQVESVAALVETYGEALSAQNLAEIELRTATRRKQQARKSAEEGLTALASLVAYVSGGRKEIIAGSGMEPRRPRARLGQLGLPQDLRAEPSPLEGCCDLSWEGVRGASVYEVEYKLHPQTAPWLRFTACTASKCRVTGLEPGTAYYFRVRAIGAAGPGPWSDPALRRAS